MLPAAGLGFLRMRIILVSFKNIKVYKMYILNSGSEEKHTPIIASLASPRASQTHSGRGPESFPGLRQYKTLYRITASFPQS